jgi:hypothetical protein
LVRKNRAGQAVYEEMHTYIRNLASEGVCLVAAKRAVVFKAQASAPGIPTDILYVVAFPKDTVPEQIAVQRQVRFG